MTNIDDQSSQLTLGTTNSTIRSDNGPRLELPESDTASDHSEDTEPQNQLDDGDDPLQVRRLALNFDYLMYKIQDRTSALAEAVRQNVDHEKRQQELEISQIARHIKAARRLIGQCDLTNQEIDKLEQLQLITRDFRGRLKDVDSRLKEHNKEFKGRE